MHKHCKRIVSALMAAAMVVPMNISKVGPLFTSAYEVLGESTFDYKLLPWTPVELNHARQDFDIDEGAAHLTIIEPIGDSRKQWELRFEHKGIYFQKGHEYKISFKAKAKREGMELCSYIGKSSDEGRYLMLDGETDSIIVGPEWNGKWGTAVKLTEDYKTYSCTIKAPDDVGDAEWVFSYAADFEQYGGNAVKGDEIWFDDMSIEDLTDKDYIPPERDYGYTSRSNRSVENNYISVNQLGYYTNLEKTATLSDNNGDITPNAEKISITGSYTFEVVRADDDAVMYTDKTGTPVSRPESGDTVCNIDFTKFDLPGEYYIRIKGKEWRSVTFRIGTDIYSKTGLDLLTNSLNYFYQTRSGSDIETDYITSGDRYRLAHMRNPDDGVGFVQTERNSGSVYSVDEVSKNSSSRIDTSGGWFNGADFDKDMSEAGTAVWTLQNMYEHSIQDYLGKAKFADNSGTVVIPESGNGYPDILDECRYELDYLSKMKVKSGEKAWGSYAGMYYDCIKGAAFEPNPKAYDHEFHAAYAVEPPTFNATLSYAACAAQAARLWAPYDSEYAEELLTNAKEAYQAYKTAWEDTADDIQARRQLYAPQERIKTDTGSEAEIADIAYWAACELYISASEMNDADESKLYKEFLDQSDNISFTERSASTAALMSMTLRKELDSDALNEEMLKLADKIVVTQSDQGYDIPYEYEGEGYELGSNELALRNMMLVAYAYDISGKAKYLNSVALGMDYLLGKNALSYSFVTGYGSYSVNNPTHYYWRNSLDYSLPAAPKGVLASGPSTTDPDPYMRALGFTATERDLHEQRYYVDSLEAWSVNESSVSGNAALAWVVSFMQDATRPESMAGDVNNDGKFNIADAVLLQKWLLGVKGVVLRDWKAADLCADNRLDIFDLTIMKQELLTDKNMPNYVEPDNQVTFGSPLLVLKDGLIMYSGPETFYAPIATLPKGTRLNELGYMDYDNKWMFTRYDDKYGWIRLYEDDDKTMTVYYEAVAAKPVIYLYPEQETDVHVELELTESELSTTYPRYNNGWDVTASPDGSLINKADGTHHRYLFWDSTNCRTRFDFSKGFCVAGSDTESFLRDKLTYMGLNEDEMNEFIVYWLPRMEHNDYNLIAFQNEAYTDSAKLTVTPAPDSECRIFMAYVPLNEAVDIEPQQLSTFERKGFAVVEWGGSEIAY